MISLIQLEYIVAIDNYRHFAKAAQACNVTQPTLSMQLKKLEEEIGVEIFDRNKQPIIPTTIGVALIQQARTVLKEHQLFLQHAQNFHATIEGTLKLAIIPTIAPYLLPFFISSFKKKYPNIKLRIIELTTEQIIQALHKDELDAAILATPLHEPNIIEVPLYYETIKVYAQKKHPLLSRQFVVPNDIVRDDIWMLAKGNCFRAQVINLCTSNKKLDEEQLVFESSSLETLKKMVDIEGGFTLLPELAYLDLPARKLEQIIAFKQPEPIREVSLIYSRTAAKQRILSALQEEIQINIPQELVQHHKGKVVEWR